MKIRRQLTAVLSLLMIATIVFPTPAWADNAPLSDAVAASLIIPAHPGLPLAHPVSAEDVTPPPLSLVKDEPVNPAYVPGLPGFKEGVVAKDDNGRVNKNSDSIQGSGTAGTGVNRSLRCCAISQNQMRQIFEVNSVSSL